MGSEGGGVEFTVKGKIYKTKPQADKGQETRREWWRRKIVNRSRHKSLHIHVGSICPVSGGGGGGATKTKSLANTVGELAVSERLPLQEMTSAGSRLR